MVLMAASITVIFTCASTWGTSASRLLRTARAASPAVPDVARSIAMSKSSTAAFTAAFTADGSRGSCTARCVTGTGSATPRARASRSWRSLMGKAGGSVPRTASNMACSATAPCKRANFVSPLRTKFTAMNASSYIFNASKPSARWLRIECRPRSIVQVARRRQPRRTFPRMDMRIPSVPYCI